MRLTCVVENCVGHGAPLWGEHGLSFLIEASGQRVLLDTGQSGEVLRHNMEALGLWQQPLHHLVLSHAHYDHTGGVATVLSHWPDVAVHAHPGILDRRLSLSEPARSIGLPADLADDVLSKWDLDARITELTPDVATTGTIKMRPNPLGSSPKHAVERQGQILPDDYADDMALVLRVEGGMVLLCGCCHAGLRNTILRLRTMTFDPLVAVIGGTHLEQAETSELEAVARLLWSERNPQLYLGHCTGERAIDLLRGALGDVVHRCPAGTVIEFPDDPSVSG